MSAGFPLASESTTCQALNRKSKSSTSAAIIKPARLDPDDGKTHLALGGAYAYHGKPEQALAAFDRAETLSPSDADLLLVIAWSIPALGESARAVILAEQAH